MSHVDTSFDVNTMVILHRHTSLIPPIVHSSIPHELTHQRSYKSPYIHDFLLRSLRMGMSHVVTSFDVNTMAILHGPTSLIPPILHSSMPHNEHTSQHGSSLLLLASKSFDVDGYSYLQTPTSLIPSILHSSMPYTSIR
jgi:hypothetical protein